jgi:hypothetical protein
LGFEIKKESLLIRIPNKAGSFNAAPDMYMTLPGQCFEQSGFPGAVFSDKKSDRRGEGDAWRLPKGSNVERIMIPRGILIESQSDFF